MTPAGTNAEITTMNRSFFVPHPFAILCGLCGSITGINSRKAISMKTTIKLTLLTALLLAPLTALHANDKQLGKTRPGKNDDYRKTSV